MRRVNGMQQIEEEMDEKNRRAKDREFEELMGLLSANTKERYALLKKLEQLLESYEYDVTLSTEELEEKRKMLEAVKASIKKLEQKHHFSQKEEERDR